VWHAGRTACGSAAVSRGAAGHDISRAAVKIRPMFTFSQVPSENVTGSIDIFYALQKITSDDEPHFFPYIIYMAENLRVIKKVFFITNQISLRVLWVDRRPIHVA
jgi:hypothetical protein